MRSEELAINFGPQHPSAHGVFRAIFHVDGEVVTKIEPKIGYLHRCFEKIAENRTYTQFIPYTDRMDYVSSMLNNWAYVLTVEKLAGIEVPERAEYIRVIVGELQRIASHLVFLTTAGVETGAVTPYMYYFDEREQILNLFEGVCGARLTYNYMRIGGVSADLPDGWLEDTKVFLKRLAKTMDETDKLLLGNYIFKKRMIGMVPFTAEDALKWGLTGPSLRAAGVPYDIRKADPYSVYPRIDFDVCTRFNCDNYDRASIRSDEIRQSMRIIEQAIEQIPDGPVKAEGIPKVFKPAAGEAYGHVEASRGDLGFYIVSDGTTKPYRVKIQGPSFGNLQALPAMAEGSYFGDVILAFGTLDTVFGEVDR
ncbi:MAG: NADH dehydrogenase [Candidatus Aquicultor primus]|uniref:NADH-quinone oxidoreductase subunit D n=1 Tax=Candidatus Aquicultor primus TaxID=1797195 RepID=A0A1F2UJI7_9ACTN|nr:MAG: NADH dehydrogenase [Candidatus Aquicultor primus]